MKKAFLFAAVVIAAVAGTFCYNHESDNEMSETAKANVKALAKDELPLGDRRRFTTACPYPEYRVRVSCLYGGTELCDPSDCAF